MLLAFPFQCVRPVIALLLVAIALSPLATLAQDAAQEATTAPENPAHVCPPPEQALKTLMEGNKRFVRGESKHPHEAVDYRASLAKGQHPFATVLACSDSRVTPVLIFDQGVGDLFVIRVAGNIIDNDVTGSIEYAVDHCGTRLVIVMGHKGCGAVTAAYHAYVARDLGDEPKEIKGLLARIEPSLKDLDRSQSVDKQIEEGVRKNVELAIRKLSEADDVRHSLATGHLVIRGAIYDLETGVIELMAE